MKMDISEALHHTETAQIIQFSASRPKVRKSWVARENPTSNPQCEGDVSATCKNHRLRRERHTEWRRADAVREYWRATLKMDGAIERVQSHGLVEGNSHPVSSLKWRPATAWTRWIAGLS
jgi:hypothetical protein